MHAYILYLYRTNSSSIIIRRKREDAITQAETRRSEGTRHDDKCAKKYSPPNDEKTAHVVANVNRDCSTG